MRLYLGLLLTTAIEALLALIGLSILFAATIYAIAQGVMIEAAILIGFAASLLGMWAVFSPLKLERGLQEILCRIAGQAAQDLSLNQARGRAFALAAGVTLGLASLIFLPLAILLSGWLHRNVVESLTIVLFLELFIGAPTLFFFATRAYSRAKDHFFQGDDGPPKSPDLDDRISASLEKDLNTPS